MQAIECPECGCKDIRMITDEKYECLGCNKTFLIHNLSKEFKKTDEHIKEVHEDLKETIRSLNNISATANGQINNPNGLDNMCRNAETLLRQGKIDQARELFIKICNEYIWSYKGYYGLFRCMRQQPISDWNSLSEYVKQMRACEDYNDDIDKTIQEIYEDGRKSTIEELNTSIDDFKKSIEKESIKYNSINADVDKKSGLLSEKKETFAQNWAVTSIPKKILGILVIIITIGALGYFGMRLFSWLIGVRHLFTSAFNAGFFGGIVNILKACVITVVRAAVFIGALFGIIAVGIFVESFVTANPKKDNEQSEIDKLDKNLKTDEERLKKSKNRIEQAERQVREMEKCVSDLQGLEKSDVFSIGENMDKAIKTYLS